MHFRNQIRQHFPGGPMVKTLSSNAGGEGSTPGQAAKIPYVSWLKKTKAENNIGTNSIKTSKMAHIKKKKK